MRFYKLLAFACVFGAAILTQPTTARADGWADTLSYRPFTASMPTATPRRAKTVRPERAARPSRSEQAARPSRPQRTARTSPKAVPTGVVHTGVASFYWQPQRVASGGWFNPNAMTAAHKTLPFGTRVRVTHLGNGRSVEVVINDRGPYIAGRIIDLSKAAAGVINMQGQGIAKVRMEVLGR